MAQYIFGSGEMFVVPLQDATGASVSNPTPAKLMDLQEGTVDLSAEQKMLYGQNSFPVAVGVGKRGISVKAKPARVYANAWNTLLFGQTLATGLTAAGTSAVTIAATVTITPPSSGTYSQDLGVIDVSTGLPMKRVASAPATGQYSVNTGTGAYTFAAADVGKSAAISYRYAASVSGSSKQTVSNLAMGYAPTFNANLTVSYLGKITSFYFPLCVASKMTLAVKNEDFAVPEFEFAAFDNGSGTVMEWSTSE